MSDDPERGTVVAAIHLLRRGDRAEMLRAAEQINGFLHEASINEEAVQHLIDMHRNNALQTLLSAFIRCGSWPEVELPVSRAIAHLVAVEDEYEWNLLQQNAREILSALQILVSQQLSSTLVMEQVLCLQESTGTLTSNSTDNSETRRRLSFPPQAAISETTRLREIIAKAVFKLCFVLSKHWGQGGQTHQPTRPPSISNAEHLQQAEGAMSYRELRRSRGLSRQVTDISQLLGMIANIISLLVGDEGGAASALDESTVLCASAMLSLSKVKQGKQSFVTHGSMALVARWLEEARFVLADAYNKQQQLPEDHLVYKLMSNVCGVLVAVVAPTEGSSPGVIGGGLGVGEHDYSIGWADSQIIAMGIPSTIVKVISSSIRFERSFDSLLESCVILFDYKVLYCFAETLFSLSTRSHNRPQLTDAKIPTALCVLLLSTMAPPLPSSPTNLQAQTQQTLGSAAVAAILPIVMAHSQIVATTVDPRLRKMPDQMTLHLSGQTQQQQAGITAHCLNALSYFLDDEFSSADYSAGTGPGPGPSTPALVEMLCNEWMVRSLAHTLSSRSSAQPQARLACLRVVSCLSEWAASIDAMMGSDIAFELIRICADEADEQRSTVSFGGLRGAVMAQQQQHDQQQHSPAASVASSSHRLPAAVSNGLPPLPPPPAAVEDSSSSDSAEEVLTASYSLANIASSNIEYARLLYERDLLTVMLDLTQSGSVEAERQAMRCICAMCQIVAKSPYDAVRFDKVLASLASAVRSPNALMQLEAVRAIAFLATANDKIKGAVVEGPLQTIVGMLIDPNSENSLRVAAEAVLKNLGFKNGVKDLELCQFDFYLLKDWYGVKSWCTTQAYGSVLLSEWISDLFSGIGLLDILIPQHGVSSHAISNKSRSNSYTNMQQRALMGGDSNSGMSMQPPKLTLQRSVTDGIKSLFAFNRHVAEVPVSVPPGSIDDSADSDLKDSIVTSLLLKRSASSSGFSSGSNHGFDRARVLSETSGSQSGGGGDKAPVLVIDLFCQLYPSRIQRDWVIGLGGLGIQDKRGLLSMPKMQEVSAVLLPARSYSSFSKIGRIIERMVEDSVYRRWAITFQESSFFGDFYVTLLETIRRCPQIIALHFHCTAPNPDARLGYLAGNFPSNVQFLSFSNALSPESIETLVVLLKNNNAAFSSSIEDSMMQPVIEDVLVGVLGLAIMHQQSLDSKAIASLCALLIPHEQHEVDAVAFDEVDEGFPTLSIPNIPACRGLKYLDLSHNRLSDAMCAEVIKHACASTLEYLDLGYNVIQKGALVRDALEKHINNSQLRHLGLAHNELSKKVLSGFLDAARGNSTLTSLDVSSNDFKFTSQKEYLNESLRLFLRDNSTCRQMDLSHNNLEVKSIASIHLGLLRNETMLIILLAGNPGIKAKDYELVLDKLKVNRTTYKEQVHSRANQLPSRRYSQSASDDLFAVKGDYIANHLHSPLSPLLSSHLSVRSQLSQEQAVLDSIFFDEESKQASLTVLFSAPLAWRDRGNKLYPIDALDHQAEREALIQVFREVRRDISLSFDFATTDRLRTALSLGCRALHFSGHGHPSCLVFEDGQSGLQSVSVESLKSLVRAGGLSLDLVFVSACHSRNTGEAFAEAGVPHVVCCKIDAKVLDSAAMAFTRAFYLSLLSGHAVRKSFDIAREALRSSPYVVDSAIEGEKFILLPERASHDVPLFKSPQVPRWPAGLTHMPRDPATANVDISLLPSPPPDFEGREVDMFRVISTLRERRLVSVVGDSGQGKSALVAAITRYMADRGMFGEGVLFVRLAGASTHHHFLLAFKNAMSRGPAKVAGKLSSTSTSAGSGSGTGSGNGGNTSPAASSINELEEGLVKILSTLEGRLLIVLDHADELLAMSDTAADLNFFLQKVFERCDCARVLVTYCASDSTLRALDSVGVVEHCVSLGSLTLISTLRLFARLAPCLPSAETKQSFVDSLLPPKQANCTFTSKDLTPVASQIFCLFGKGHPATIVKMACEANMESVTGMQGKGRDILSGHKTRRSSISISRSRSGENGNNNNKPVEDGGAAGVGSGSNTHSDPTTAAVPAKTIMRQHTAVSNNTSGAGIDPTAVVASITSSGSADACELNALLT